MLGAALLGAAAVAACPTNLPVSKLRAAIAGDVLTPTDPGYPNATVQWNARFTRHPCLIVQCNNTADVQEAMGFARDHGLALSARSGGHSYTGLSVIDNTLTIDMKRLSHIRVLPGNKEAEIGPGALSYDVAQTLSQQYGLMTSTGGCPDVALGGFLQGGGHPIIARSTGAGLDNVLGHEVVLANGTAVNTSATEHPDLYWGLRGGCGFSFGIVTSFRMKLYPECMGEGSCLAGRITYNGSDALTVSKFFVDFASSTDNKLGLMSASGANLMRVHGVYNGDADAGLKALEPLLNIPNTTVVSNTFTKFDNYFEAWHFGVSNNHIPPPPGTLRVVTQGTFLKELLPDENILALFSEGHGFEMTAMGGEWSAPATNATAYPHRDYKVNFFMQPVWREEDDDAKRLAANNASYYKHVYSHCAPNCSIYCNYPDSSLPDYANAYWGPNLPRLQTLKRRYDPEEVFSFAQSIPPGHDEL